MTVRAAVGLAAANLDAQLGAIDADTGTALPALIAALNDLDAAGVRAAVGLAAANLDAQLGAIDADTGTTLPALIAALNDPSAATVAAAVLAGVVEVNGSITLQQALSVMLAASAGVTTDGGATLKDATGTATRIAATINASNERTVMTLTPSA